MNNTPPLDVSVPLFGAVNLTSSLNWARFYFLFLNHTAGLVHLSQSISRLGFCFFEETSALRRLLLPAERYKVTSQYSYIASCAFLRTFFWFERVIFRSITRPGTRYSVQMIVCLPLVRTFRSLCENIRSTSYSRPSLNSIGGGEGCTGPSDL
jgi:hypothetical protein